jgi:hypothetical protein
MDGTSAPVERSQVRGSKTRTCSAGDTMRRRLCALLCALSIVAIGDVAAQAFTAQSGCRDGVPHGAWQLTDAKGHMRVLGAFNRGRRTGSFIFWDANGVRVAHLPYEEGARNGTLALWHAKTPDVEGPQRLEAGYAAGRLNGIVRAWDESGRLRGEYRYQAGALVDARAWDARGREASSQDAREQAAKDASSNESYLRTLEALVARHARSCGAETFTTTQLPL